ncbi:hypothetical protein HPB50_008975 [Hyalomma asiaticum]|uniref:Uncharacterized protein n=1 Tax=Hyalomma asiaticum TaxID=266040 RepID=A0ACB7RV91_HYAAI|nr:hypothetical protein HPB50_008975 [Hyalomma asiaticum]
MAAIIMTLALMTMFQLGYASNKGPNIVAARCDSTPDIDLTETVNAYLRRIPDTIPIAGAKAKTWIMGFKTSAPEVTGLGSLWAYKPPYVFCSDNRTFVEVEAFIAEPLRIQADWKSCTGSRGKLGTTVSNARLLLYFAFGPTHDGTHGVQLYNISPESLEDARVFVEGIDRSLNSVMEGLNIVFMPHLHLFWNRFIRVGAHHIITR